jgi:ATP-binding cassette subfamily B protein
MQNGFWNNMFQGAMVNRFEIGLIATVIVLWGMGVASAGLMLLVVVYVLRSFNIVWMISRNVINISRALTGANEMVEILDAPLEVADPLIPEAIRMTEGQVVFTEVTHAYDNAGHVFRDLSLDIRAGEKVAFVGHSGAGKTTIVKLLLRFLDIESGTITIDGQDITKVTQDDLRRHIAYVPQEPILFHRSLFDNIAYGKPDATREEVEEVARRARAHDFIAKLPNGYDTLVGERGVKLSGGERQRVAIARALLKDAPIVVLDEATSSLDSISERFIQEAFDELMQGRTTIVIAHRLSTIQHMDRIIVLDNGGVAEQGTHAELLAQNGIYAELWNSQVGGFIKDDMPVA